MNIKLNIGLITADKKTNVDWEKLCNYLSQHTNDFKFIQSKIVGGEWHNIHEKTIFIKAKWSNKFSELVNLVERMCISYKQECIALKSEIGDMLIYNPNYKGDILKFNNDFFIEE